MQNAFEIVANHDEHLALRIEARADSASNLTFKSVFDCPNAHFT